MTSLFSDSFASDPATRDSWQLFRATSNPGGALVWDAAGTEHLSLNQQNVGGAMLAGVQLPTDRAWESTFRFNVGQTPAPAMDADGFTFMFWKDLSGYTSQSTSHGGSLGFSGQTQWNIPGFGVEFDNFRAGLDPTQHYVAILKDGAQSKPVGNVWTESATTHDNAWHTAKVTYDPSSRAVSVSIDGTKVLGPVPLPAFQPYGYIGFSAGTGVATDDHQVDALVIRAACAPSQNALPPIPQPSPPCVQLPGPDCVVDSTPPEIVATVDPAQPDAENGWYKSDVTISWTVTETRAPGILLTEGCQSVKFTADIGPTEVTCRARSLGGVGSKTLTIKRDSVAPVLTANTVPGGVGPASWYNARTGAPRVTWICTDQTSGVPSCPTSVLVGQGQNQKVSSGTVKDAAGNTADEISVSSLNVDTIPPTVTRTMTPATPAATGWYNAATGAPTISYSCSDANLVSCPSSHTFGQGASLTWIAEATDKADNVAQDTITGVKVDLVGPQIGSVVNSPDAGTGWYNARTGPPAIAAACSDKLSGVATCEVPQCDSNCPGVLLSEDFSTDPATRWTTYRANPASGDEGVWDDANGAEMLTRAVGPRAVAMVKNVNLPVETPWDASFRFRVGQDPASTTDGSGFTFMFWKDGDAFAGSRPATGEWMGFLADGQTNTRGFGVEFDNSQAGADPSAHYVALVKDSLFTVPPISAAYNTAATHDFAWHTATVHYLPKPSRIAVEVDGQVAIAPFALPSFTPYGYVGFSAGTDSHTDNHFIDDLLITTPGRVIQLPGDGAGKTFTAVASDVAGNPAAPLGPFNVDLTPPTGSVVGTIPDATSGWYNIATGAPTLVAGCADATSGCRGKSLADDFSETPENRWTFFRAANDPASEGHWAGASGGVDLTTAVPSRGVAMVRPFQLPTNNAWDASFRFKVGQSPSANPDGSGFTFMFWKDISRYENAGKPATGSWLGFVGDGSTSTAGFGIEFDNAKGGSDPSAHYIAVVKDSLFTTPPLEGKFYNTDKTHDFQWHNAKVHYLTNPSRIVVDIDGQQVLGPVNLPAGFTPYPYVGFSAGTDGNKDQHTIDDLVIGLAPAATFGEGQNQLASWPIFDVAGNQGTVTATVNVDLHAPTLAMPTSETLEAIGPNGATALFDAPTATDNFAGATASCNAQPGTFPLGDTTVGCSAVDIAGNRVNGAFHIVVRDTTAPALSVPANRTVEATGPSGAIVAYAASANDLVDGNVPIACTPASGSTFDFGTTIVSCSATDTRNNAGQAAFAVTVVDTTAPAVVVPASQTLEATSAAGAVATFEATATDVVDGNLTATCAPASGSTFALGATTVICSATDAHSNLGQGSFVVTVVDTTAPTLNVPADMTIVTNSTSGMTVSYATAASDLVDGSVTPTCAPASGSLFAPGTTSVTCTAVDAHGNAANATFAVHVIYEFAGFEGNLADGSGSGRAGHDMTVAFTLSGASEPIHDATPTLMVAPIVNGEAGSEFYASSTHQTSNIFDWHNGKKHYEYRWNTDGLAAGTYELRVDVGDGVVHTATVQLT